MKIIECEIQNEDGDMLELVKVVGDESFNRLSRTMRKYGLELVEVSSKIVN